jgi:cob(I)alamin adenosyltransferase
MVVSYVSCSLDSIDKVAEEKAKRLNAELASLQKELFATKQIMAVRNQKAEHLQKESIEMQQQHLEAIRQGVGRFSVFLHGSLLSRTKSYSTD